MEQIKSSIGSALIVVNLRSRLDVILIAALLDTGSWLVVSQGFIPGPFWQRLFAGIHFKSMESQVQEGWRGVECFLRKGGVVALFPEWVPAADDSFSKMEEGPLLGARVVGATVFALHLDGSQYRQGSGREPALPRRLFPALSLSVLRPEMNDALLVDLLGQAMVAHFKGRETLWNALCRAGRLHGLAKPVLADSTGVTLTYRQMFVRARSLGAVLAKKSHPKERIGILLPTSVAGVVTFFALLAWGRVPVLLNFTSSEHTLISACKTGGITTVITARLFAARAGLTEKLAVVGQSVNLLYLEDLRLEIGLAEKIFGLIGLFWPEWGRNGFADDPREQAVILFTSGSEGEPKGVVLSHDNLLCNMVQIRSRIGLRADDLFLNVLPLFHGFGLTVGTLAPLLAGVRCHLHPSPLEYKKISELAFQTKATIFAGTNTFLAGVARVAHPFDFHTIRVLVAGAEVLREETRQLWMEKFGVRIFEGYGVTEASPVLAVNTTILNRSGTVGRLLPGIEYQLQSVAGIAKGGVLMVKGENIMIGYLLPESGLVPRRLETSLGFDWYDTGDVVVVDGLGFLRIVDRVKRFAKVGGEMISLATVEQCAASVWPHSHHAAVAVADAKKGEKICLLTDQTDAERTILFEYIKNQGLTALYLPGQIFTLNVLPITGTGKVDYVAVKQRLSEIVDSNR
ncbi:MAG: AMP-binding protein [Magnetococcales bacterium]|nr:AMP-binding protein [Magnetococcales bacterium]